MSVCLIVIGIIRYRVIHIIRYRVIVEFVIIILSILSLTVISFCIQVIYTH